MALKVSEPTVRSSLTHLEKLNIVKEMTGRLRGRLFMYSKYLHILDEGTEPLRNKSRYTQLGRRAAYNNLSAGSAVVASGMIGGRRRWRAGRSSGAGCDSGRPRL